MKAAPRSPREVLRADAMLGRAPVAFAVTEGPRHALVYANTGFRRLQAAGEIALGSGPSASPAAADLSGVLDDVFTSEHAAVHVALKSPDNPLPTWRCNVWPMETSKSGPKRLVIEVEDVSLAEDERAWHRTLSERLILGAFREQDAARDAAEARGRALFVARVSRELAASLDEGATRELVRRLALPRPGSWVIVDVVEADGSVRRLPVTHPDPGKQDLARSLEALWPATPRPTIVRAMHRRDPVMVGDESGSTLLLAAHGQENLRLLREIGFGALLVVPMIVRARVQGSMTFVSPAGDALFSTDEITMAVDLAARCGLALDNARLYREADGLRLAAELANQSKVQFLGGMSHELRTPLNAIGGFTELMELEIPGPVNDEQRRALGRIKANQKHLLGLITEVLTFARIESGRIEYEFAEVPMNVMLREVIEMLGGAVQEAGLSLVVPEIDPECRVWADPVRIRQILANLVINATKYAAVRGGSITLECTRSGSAVVTTVTDTGNGIPANKLETIFEPFVQLSGGLADRREGVGLGLAISRDLARAMGGDLSAESTLGTGSCFSLTLPHARGAAARQP